MNELLTVAGLAIDVLTREGPRALVRDVGFRLNRGEALGLVGESGSGKTLTCRALVRLLPSACRVVAGKVTLSGAGDLLAMDERALTEVRGRRVAMIFQNPTSHLDPVMRIGEQIAEGLILHQGLDRSVARRRSIELLDEVGIADPAHTVDAWPHQLSGGMRQRAMIAAALACEPDLLIADEPTTALDVTIQAQIIDLLRRLRGTHGLAVILVSHDLALVGDFCERVAVMRAGRIVEAGETAAILAHPRHPYTRELIGSQPRLVPPGHYFPVSGAPAERAPRVKLGGGAPLLEVADLVVTFQRPRRVLDLVRRRPATYVRAVDRVGFALASGDALGIVGESGSGKSTLARAIVGLVTPSAGAIRLVGDERETPRYRRVQMIFQDPLSALNPRLSVAQTLTEPLIVHRLCRRAEVATRVAALMAEVGLDPALAHRRPRQLSGGQCQRVGIARALALSPAILIADEPTSALDVTIQAQILNLLIRLRAERQLALILISHDLEVVRRVCERVIVMRHGRVVEEGPAERIFAAPQAGYTRELLAAIPGTRGFSGGTPLAWQGVA